ncbi:MAG TPA: EamA family transporter, partial [Gammaproteobacteria bacterium]
LHRHTVRFALANAGVIAAYTLVDGIGARLSGQPFAYTAWLFVLTAPVLFAAALPLHGSRLWSGWRRWPRGLLGGACTLAAYALALWAMTRAPLALVAALRETSAVFALLLGTLWLREPLSRSRVVAVGVVAAGAMAIRLA